MLNKVLLCLGSCLEDWNAWFGARTWKNFEKQSTIPRVRITHACDPKFFTNPRTRVTHAYAWIQNFHLHTKTRELCLLHANFVREAQLCSRVRVILRIRIDSLNNPSRVRVIHAYALLPFHQTTRTRHPTRTRGLPYFTTLLFFSSFHLFPSSLFFSSLLFPPFNHHPTLPNTIYNHPFS